MSSSRRRFVDFDEVLGGEGLGAYAGEAADGGAGEATDFEVVPVDGVSVDSGEPGPGVAVSHVGEPVTSEPAAGEGVPGSGYVPKFPGAMPNGHQVAQVVPTPPSGSGLVRSASSVTFVDEEGTRVTVLDSGKPSAASGRIYPPKGAAKGRVRTTQLGEPVRIQNRDVLWLRQVARYGSMSYEELTVTAQVMGFPKTTLAATRERMRRLIKAGVFEAWDVPSSGLNAHLVTPTTRALARYGLAAFSVREPNPMDVLHTSAVARLGLYLESLDVNYERSYVFTEGEIFTLKRTGEAPLLQLATEHWGDQVPDVTDRYCFLTPRDGGFTFGMTQLGEEYLRGGYFQPDLVLLRPGSGPVAIEVERRAKTDPSYYEEKFASYVASDNYAGVQYVCLSATVARMVGRAVKAVPGASEKIAVEMFPDTKMPLPPLRLERITARRLPKSRGLGA